MSRLFLISLAEDIPPYTRELRKRGIKVFHHPHIKSIRDYLITHGSTLDFDIDPFAKRMILAGTDELGYLLAKDAELTTWEAAHPPRIDSLAEAG